MRKEDGRKDWENPWAEFNTPTPLGGGLKPPWGGVPPPNVFGVRRVAIRKGAWKKKAWRFKFS